MADIEEAGVQALAVERFERIDVTVLNLGDGPVFTMAHISAEEVLANMRLNYDTFVH